MTPMESQERKLPVEPSFITMAMRKKDCRFRYRLTILSTAAALLSSKDGPALAFQPSAPSVMRREKRGPDSLVVQPMAETSFPFGREDRAAASFLGPLFQDHDWTRQRARRGLLSTSSLIFSSRGSFSFLEESNLDDDDEDLLEYLPSGGADLTPKTRELLQRVTSEYVNGGDPMVQAGDVLDVIGAEYKSRDVSVIVGDEIFDFTASGEVDDADVARILSFAAYHRLPRDVALLLFGPSDDEDQVDSFARCRNALARGGWKEVRFPRGLAIRPRRKFVKSTRKRYMPMPWNWTTSRKDTVRIAEVAVNEAMYVQAPPRRLMSREEFLASIDKELASTEPTESRPFPFREARQFFPRQNLKLKRLRKVLKKQTALMKDAGLAGLISYVTLSFAWYTCAIFVQWRHTSPTVEITSRALGTAMRRFGKVLVAAYIGSQLTRMLRLKMALVLAPFGNRALRLTQKKLRISETKAFALLSGVVVGTCLAVWSIIVLGDAALLRTGALGFDQVGIESSF